MITYKQVLGTLRGSGKFRKPKQEFWDVWRHWRRVLQAAGLRVFKDEITPRDPGPWLVNLSEFTRDSLARALTQVMPEGESPNTQLPCPPLPPDVTS